MIINDKFKKLIPPLSAEEYAQLEENCKADGIRDPLVVWRGTLIDGHNRYDIAQKHGLDYTVVEKEFEDETAAKIWMVTNQFGRRNLNNYQRSVLALSMEELFKEKAKEKEHARKTSTCQNSDKSFEEIDTKKEIGKLANVSHDTIMRVKKIEATATPETIAAVRSGEKSINEAYKEIRATEKKEERIELITQQIEDIESGKLPELQGLYSVISIDPPWNYEGEKSNSYDANGRRVANPYPEMPTEEIKKIELPLLPDAVVLLWTTHKFLPDAFDILKAWGLQYKATMVWNKEKIGMGAWLRMQCEFCLVGIRGNPFWENTLHRDIITEPRREHSRKPDKFFTIIEEITKGRKLEYFSREKRENWDVFGNDTERFENELAR